MFVFHGGALLGGCALDWLFGDPRWLPHPVRLMGRMIAWLEGLLRPRFSGRERAAGLLLAALMCCFWTVVPGLLLAALGGVALYLPGRAGAYFLLAAESLMCYQLLAAKDLCAESMKVCRSMEKGDVEEARRSVSMIVGRQRHPAGGGGDGGGKRLRRRDRSHALHSSSGTCGRLSLQSGEHDGFHGRL